jgi:hypothetical protein
MANESGAVEWHTIGEYRVSFDVRADASRFIILGPPKDRRPNLIGKGLIDDTTGALFDEPHEVPAEVLHQMLSYWRAMVERLRAAGIVDVVLVPHHVSIATVSTIYAGWRTPDGAVVRVARYGQAAQPGVFGNDVRELPARQDLYNHSPQGFEWGYEGSGPAQLALAILADYLDDKRALAGGLYQVFKRAVIAGLTGDSWTITDQLIDAFLAEHEGRES